MTCCASFDRHAYPHSIHLLVYKCTIACITTPRDCCGKPSVLAVQPDSTQEDISSGGTSLVNDEALSVLVYWFAQCSGSILCSYHTTRLLATIPFLLGSAMAVQ